MKQLFTINEEYSPIYHLTGGDTGEIKPMIFRRKAYAYWCIEYIVNGAGYLQVDDEKFNIETGDIYILPKGKNHEYGPDNKNPWRKFYIVIDGPLIEELTKIYGIQNTYHFTHLEATKEIFEKAIHALEKRDETLQSQIALFIHEIIIHLASKTKKGRDTEKGLPAKIKRYLDASLGKPLTLEELSNEFNFTKAHLVRVFRSHYKMTPYEYFLSRKFSLACFYLTETEFSLKQIADKLCFRDEYYFSRFFCQRSKIPPGQFRKQSKEKLKT